MMNVVCFLCPFSMYNVNEMYVLKLTVSPLVVLSLSTDSLSLCFCKNVG